MLPRITDANGRGLACRWGGGLHRPAAPGTFETPNKAELLKVGLGLQDQRDRVKAGEVAMAARAGPAQPLALRGRQTQDRWMGGGIEQGHLQFVWAHAVRGGPSGTHSLWLQALKGWLHQAVP